MIDPQAAEERQSDIAAIRIRKLEAEIEHLRSWRAAVVQEAMAQGWAEGFMAHVDPKTSGLEANPYALAERHEGMGDVEHAPRPTRQQ